MAENRDPDQRGWLINLVGWLSLAGLLATGAIGLAGGIARDTREHLVGPAYLLIGGLAFAAVLLLILRRGPFA